MLLGILRLPPLVVLVIVLALLAYLVYHIVSTGQLQPLPAIAVVVLGFVLVRLVWRMRRKAPVDEGD